MIATDRHTLRLVLERLYQEYDFAARIPYDPIEIPRAYSEPRDVEVAALISACLAYGRVDLFKPQLRAVLGEMGPSPYRYVMGFDPKGSKRAFRGFLYRINRPADIRILCLALRRAYERHGTLERLFLSGYDPTGEDLLSGLKGFVGRLLDIDPFPVTGRDRHTNGYRHLLPRPELGSACKRLHLFLRWMVRRDGRLDFGLWRRLSPSKLLIPLDTHVARICRYIGLTDRTDASLRTAREITARLRELDPRDPVKYDFAICHLGISGACRHLRDPEVCPSCPLDEICTL